MKKCGIVTMINPYQIYNLKQHIESSQLHGGILERKQFHKDDEAKNRGEVRKKMTQSLLFCSKRPETSADLQESIKYVVRPQDSVLGGTSVEKYL